jgi:peroxiredoxin
MFVMLALVAVAASPSLTVAGGAEVGQPAPDFALPDQEGNQVQLSAIDGVRVLEWVNPDCPFVKRHYVSGTMKRLAEQYAPRGVTWLTINSTHYMDRQANHEFREAHGLPQPILVDQDGAVGRRYGAATTPHMFVVDADGTVVYRGAIDDDPRGSKGDGATNFVAVALDQVLGGETVAVSETKPYGCSVKYKK